MKTIIKSDTTGKEYCPSECVRLVNMKQIAFYLKHGVKVYDFYSSNDFKTGEPIVVFMVNKKESEEVYAKWMERRNG